MLIKYSNISFVIISNRSSISTITSIPQESEIIISSEFKRGTAHNFGINKTTKEWIIICDDDIKFDHIFLDFVLSLASKDTIVGLQAYYPSPMLIARFMLFHKSAFKDIGNIEEKDHGFETEWLIRAIKKNYKIVAIPRESVIHIPHKKQKPSSGEGSNILWLLKKHPDIILYMLKIVWNKLRKSSLDEEYKQ
jgi:GT2 family glycosyltransferase